MEDNTCNAGQTAQESTSVIVKVAGVTFENRQEILERFYRDWNEGSVFDVSLVPEEDNEFDKNAIGVWLEVSGKKEKVGYVPRDCNADLKAALGEMKCCHLNTIGVSQKGTIGLTIVCKF